MSWGRHVALVHALVLWIVKGGRVVRGRHADIAADDERLGRFPLGYHRSQHQFGRMNGLVAAISELAHARWKNGRVDACIFDCRNDGIRFIDRQAVAGEIDCTDADLIVPSEPKARKAVIRAVKVALKLQSTRLRAGTGLALVR